MNKKVIDNRIFFEDVAKLLSEGEQVRIRAKGNSMLPMIRDGKDEVVLRKPSNESFYVGALLLARLSPERYVLHRVTQIDGENIRMRGDGNLSVYESCKRQDIIAEVTEVVRGNKTMKQGDLRWRMYKSLWPSNSFVRRVVLAFYRRLFL